MNVSSLGDTCSKKTIPCLDKINSPTIKYTLKIYSCKKSANINVLYNLSEKFRENFLNRQKMQVHRLMDYTCTCIGGCFLFRKQFN